jgi:hypothetical protein
MAGYSSILMRVPSTIVLGCLLLGLLGLLGCQRGKQQAVVIEPNAIQSSSTSVPGDPFGSASPAYARLVEVTDAAVAAKWSGALEDETIADAWDLRCRSGQANSAAKFDP